MRRECAKITFARYRIENLLRSSFISINAKAHFALLPLIFNYRNYLRNANPHHAKCHSLNCWSPSAGEVPFLHSSNCRAILGAIFRKAKQHTHTHQPYSSSKFIYFSGHIRLITIYNLFLKCRSAYCPKWQSACLPLMA